MPPNTDAKHLGLCLLLARRLSLSMLHYLCLCLPPISLLFHHSCCPENSFRILRRQNCLQTEYFRPSLTLQVFFILLAVNTKLENFCYDNSKRLKPLVMLALQLCHLGKCWHYGCAISICNHSWQFDSILQDTLYM